MQLVRRLSTTVPRQPQTLRFSHPFEFRKIVSLSQNKSLENALDNCEDWETSQFLNAVVVAQTTFSEDGLFPPLWKENWESIKDRKKIYFEEVGPSLPVLLGRFVRWTHEVNFGGVAIPTGSPDSDGPVPTSAEIQSHLVAQVHRWITPKRYSILELSYLIRIFLNHVFDPSLGRLPAEQLGGNPRDWIAFFELNQDLLAADQKAIFLERFFSLHQTFDQWVAVQTRQLMAEPGLLSSEGHTALAATIIGLVKGEQKEKNGQPLQGPYSVLLDEYASLDVIPPFPRLGMVHIFCYHRIANFLAVYQFNDRTAAREHFKMVLLRLFAASYFPLGDFSRSFSLILKNGIQFNLFEQWDIIGLIDNQINIGGQPRGTSIHAAVLLAKLSERAVGEEHLEILEAVKNNVERFLVNEIMESFSKKIDEESMEILLAIHRVWENFPMWKQVIESTVQKANPFIAKKFFSS